MLQHFQFKSMYENKQLPGWYIAFYYKSQKYSGEYLPDGTINWNETAPPNEDSVKKIVHELMLFHVYE